MVRKTIEEMVRKTINRNGWENHKKWLGKPL